MELRVERGENLTERLCKRSCKEGSIDSTYFPGPLCSPLLATYGSCGAWNPLLACDSRFFEVMIEDEKLLFASFVTLNEWSTSPRRSLQRASSTLWDNTHQIYTQRVETTSGRYKRTGAKVLFSDWTCQNEQFRWILVLFVTPKVRTDQPKFGSSTIMSYQAQEWTARKVHFCSWLSGAKCKCLKQCGKLQSSERPIARWNTNFLQHVASLHPAGNCMHVTFLLIAEKIERSANTKLCGFSRSKWRKRTVFFSIKKFTKLTLTKLVVKLRCKYRNLCSRSVAAYGVANNSNKQTRFLHTGRFAVREL